MKSSTLLAVGAIGLVAFLFLRKSPSSTPSLVATPYPGTSTPAQIGAIAGATATLATAFKGLFSGPTTAPLTSGASPSNPNDILALPTTPMPSDDLQSLVPLEY